jgi:hypothetical protein
MSSQIPEIIKHANPVAAVQIDRPRVLSDYPKDFILKIFSFLSMEDRAQLHCVDHKHSKIVEKLCHGKIDLQYKLEMKRFNLEEADLKRKLSAIDRILSSPVPQDYVFELNELDMEKKKLLKDLADLQSNQNTCYLDYRKRNRMDRKILDLFGGRKNFENLPIYRTSQSEKYLKIHLKESDPTLVRGIDIHGRVFFALHVDDSIDDSIDDPIWSEHLARACTATITIFQRYSYEETWTSTTTGDSYFPADGHMIEEGNIKTTNNRESYQWLRRLITEGQASMDKEDGLGLTTFYARLVAKK